jgi:hypothetical protein
VFSHIMVGVSDVDRATAFCKPVLDALGIQFRFLARPRQQVDQVYALALASGGTCEGKPGLRTVRTSAIQTATSSVWPAIKRSSQLLFRNRL